MHTNKINGKRYIGQTHHDDPNKRWLNGLGYKTSPYFYNAIKKYGWDNFEHSVLFENLTKEEAEEKERQLILQYESFKRDKGYNIRYGGSASKLSEETKEKMRKSAIGRKVSEETKNKIRSSMLGEKNHFYGKKHSEDAKRKMSENHWDCSGENHYLFGKHMKEETKEKLRLANLGEKNPNYGIPKTEEQKERIRKALIGIKRSDETKQKIKDNHADFKGENHPWYGRHHTEQTKEKLSKIFSRPVDMLDLNGNYIKTFHGMSEAQRQIGANYMGISRCCSGKQKTCGGYKWRLSNEENGESYETI